MKRKTKNIIMSIIIVLLIGSIAFTIYYAKNNLENEVMVNQTDMGNMQNTNTTSDNTEEESTESENKTSENQVKQTSNENSTSEVQEKPDGENSTEEPPAKPDGDNSTSEVPEKPDGDTTTTEDKKEMPNQDSNTESTDNAQQPDMSNMTTMMPTNMDNSKSLTSIYYVIFGVEFLLLTMVILYLVLSKFNKKTIKETFVNKDKIIIYILSTLLSTLVLTILISFITNNYILKENNSNDTNTNTMNSNNTSTDITYSAANTIDESTTIEDKEYESTTADENALLITGDIEATLSNITVNKTGDSDGGDNTSFYGTNSAILVKDKAVVTLKNITVNTSATGANGVFSYGGSATTNNTSSDSTTVNISDSTITTTKDNSGGIMTTGGGIMNATNLTITTAGTSSAAIRSDRGGGEVTVKEGTYKTTGQGSPAIYSTANIKVSDATLISEASEGIVIEGKNSVTLDNVKLTDSNTKLNGQSTTYKNIFLYQSMSGDASDGTSTFSATDSTITTKNGDSFYVTNTDATISLTNNKITNKDSDGYFLRVQKDSWGNEGSNGGNVELNLTKQKVTGNIYIDSISTLTMNMKSSSTFKGYINKDNTAKNITLTLDKTSKITLTADSYVTKLEDKDTSYSNIDFNGYKLYVNGQSIN